MMTDGWIKLYRKITEWEWYTVPSMAHLFIHLLLTANHQDKKWRGTIIKQGQVVTSTRRLAEQTGLSCKTVGIILQKLEASKEIARERIGNDTFVTILNYARYQECEHFTTPTTTPTTTHNKNNKNIRKNHYYNYHLRAREILKKDFMTRCEAPRR